MADITFDICKCGSVIVSSAEAVAALKADNERLQAVLRYIAWEQKEDDKPHMIARAVLEEKP